MLNRPHPYTSPSTIAKGQRENFSWVQTFWALLWRVGIPASKDFRRVIERDEQMRVVRTTGAESERGVLEARKLVQWDGVERLSAHRREIY